MFGILLLNFWCKGGVTFEVVFFSVWVILCHAISHLDTLTEYCYFLYNWIHFCLMSIPVWVEYFLFLPSSLHSESKFLSFQILVVCGFCGAVSVDWDKRRWWSTLYLSYSTKKIFFIKCTCDERNREDVYHCWPPSENASFLAVSGASFSNPEQSVHSIQVRKRLNSLSFYTFCESLTQKVM